MHSMQITESLLAFRKVILYQNSETIYFSHYLLSLFRTPPVCWPEQEKVLQVLTSVVWGPQDPARQLLRLVWEPPEPHQEEQDLQLLQGPQPREVESQASSSGVKGWTPSTTREPLAEPELDRWRILTSSLLLSWQDLGQPWTSRRALEEGKVRILIWTNWIFYKLLVNLPAYSIYIDIHSSVQTLWFRDEIWISPLIL